MVYKSFVRHACTGVLVAALLAVLYAGVVQANSPGTVDPAAAPGTLEPLTPICGSVLYPIVPLPLSDGQVHLVYDLLLTNWTSQPVTLAELKVIDPGNNDRILAQWDQETLSSQLLRRDQPNEANTLAAGEAMVFLADIVIPEEETPAAVVHEITFASPIRAAPGLELQGQRSGAYEVAGKPVVVGLPFEGDGWIAFEFLRSSDDAAAPSHHRTSIPGIAGQMVVAQRFAYDWMRVDQKGRLFHGDPNRAQDWIAYGAPLVAVADGTIVEAVDRFPDSPLPYDDSAKELDELAGNRVVLDIGNGLHVLYAHLKPGSLTVEAGDQVARRDLLGALGQSGNSTAPHLHFHIMDRPSPSGLGAQGVPYVFDSFLATNPGILGISDDGTVSFALPEPLQTLQHRNRLPVNLSVIGNGEGSESK